MKDLVLRNRQRVRAVNPRVFRDVAGRLLDEWVPLPAKAGPGHALGVHLVGEGEMTRLNEQFLQHAGCTDVITFDHTEGADRRRLHGEMFLCMDEAVRQARRYRIPWQVELMRYFVHGVLHLLGHDDRTPAARRRMKRIENRQVRRLSQDPEVRRLARRARGAA